MVQMGGPEAKGPETFYYCHAYSVTYDSKTMYSADLFIFFRLDLLLLLLVLLVLLLCVCVLIY